MDKRFKSAVFTFIGCVIWTLTANFLAPSWNYPMSADNLGMGSNMLRNTDKDIEVIFVGGSNIEYGISPMYLYEKKHIKSYNLGTGGQPIECTQFLIEEVFRQGFKPKVIVVDPQVLFSNVEDEARFRETIDNIPFSDHKYYLLKQYYDLHFRSASESAKSRTIPELISQLYRYHSRWDKLDSSDFYPKQDDDYFMYGYYSYPMVNPVYSSREFVDYIGELLANNNNNSYTTKIRSYNAEVVIELKQLCQKNNCNIVFVKMPMQIDALSHGSSWTKSRYESTLEFLSKQEIPFIDLNYDVDIGIDWNSDTCDSGIHMNLVGAEKVTAFLAQYLDECYDFNKSMSLDFQEHQATYDKYSKVTHVALEQDLHNYLSILSASKMNYLIILSAKNGMKSGLCEADIKGLSYIDPTTEFNNMGEADSYIAVLCGDDRYVNVSSEHQVYRKQINNLQIVVESAGYLDGNVSSILINGQEYSMNQRGINIVVYDKESGLVVDRATCDTWAPEHEVKHDVGNLLFEYQEYLLGRK